MLTGALRRRLIASTLLLAAGVVSTQSVHSAEVRPSSKSRGAMAAPDVDATRSGSDAQQPNEAGGVRPQPSAPQKVDVGALHASEVVVSRRAGRIETFDPDKTATLTLGGRDLALAVTGTRVERTQIATVEGTFVPAWRLPFSFSLIKARVGVPVGGPSNQLDLEPVVETTNGLHPDPKGSGYVGRIWVGVLSRRVPSEKLALPTPVVLLMSSAQIDEIEPSQVTISYTGLPFAEVRLRAANPREPVAVRVRSSFTASGETDVPVSLVRPDVTVVASSSRILGFGLEAVDVTIQVSGLPNPNGQPVTLQSSLGKFEPGGPVLLDARGFGATKLRSAWVGTAQVTTAAAGLANSQATVTFEWPLKFLLAAAIGGALGRTVRRAAARRGNGRKWRGWGTDLILGPVAGVLATVAWTVGVNLVPALPTAVSGDALYLTLGALGGLVGLVLPGGKPATQNAPAG